MGKAIKRFLNYIAVGAESGCWEWTGTKSHIGYGQFRLEGRLTSPHRFAYMAFKGEIPEGYEVDHLCRNRACANPRHLEAVTVKENRWRRAEAMTHCKRGHELPPCERQGRRQCKPCQKLNHATWVERNSDHYADYQQNYNKYHRSRTTLIT